MTMIESGNVTVGIGNGRSLELTANNNLVLHTKGTVSSSCLLVQTITKQQAEDMIQGLQNLKVFLR